jgi:uncharacterized protein (TIGR03435 family)
VKWQGAVLGLLVFAVLTFGQRPAFEVASVKPLDPDPVADGSPMFIPMEASGGMLRFKRITLFDAIRAAYRLKDYQVQGPGWIRDARFEITAKAPADGNMDQVPEMLQSLLAERFKLELGREPKELPVYALVVDSGGAKLKAADAQKTADLPMGLGPDGKPRPVMQYSMSASGITLMAPAARLATVAEFLSRMMERPVIDMTGLSGQFDLTLPFMPEVYRGLPASSARFDSGERMFTEPGQTLFEAVKALGLKLEARKALIEMVTVVSAEKVPTEN